MKNKTSKEFKKANFPNEYPEVLRSVSWCLEGNDGVICGPHKFWNKHLQGVNRNDRRFVMEVLLDYFYNNGCAVEVCRDMCKYFVDCFSIYYKEGDERFTITTKKDKDGNKLFILDKFRRLYAINATNKEAENVLKVMCKAVIDYYNNTLTNHINNVIENKGE